MTFDPNRPVQTRDGRPARILCTDLKGDQPIAAAIRGAGGNETVSEFGENGQWLVGETSDTDLINVPEKRTVWVNIYEDGYTSRYPTRELADIGACRARIACVPLTYTVGEGL
jgi:hypothetical protein